MCKYSQILNEKMGIENEKKLEVKSKLKNILKNGKLVCLENQIGLYRLYSIDLVFQ